MNSVYADGINWMEVRQVLTIRRTERSVSAKLLYGTTGFDASHDVPFHQRLVLEADLGLHEDSHVVQAAQYSPRQGKATTRKQVLFPLHSRVSVLRPIDEQG